MFKVKVSLVLFLIMSTLGTYIIWFTNIYENFVLSYLVLTNNSIAFNMWKNPKCKIFYKVHLFNYTNVIDYKNKKANKLNLQEVGPYTYEEKLRRIDISFENDDQISFQENRTLTFNPNLSNGQENDSLYIPNMPLIASLHYVKDQNYAWRLSVSALLEAFNEGAFTSISVRSIINGYRNVFNDIGKTFIFPDIPEKTGILLTRMGVTSYRQTINTGEKDINKIGVLEKFNGYRQFDPSLDETCTRVESSTVTYFPINKVRFKQPLQYLFPEMCRRISLVFEKETTVLDGIPVYQYTAPKDRLSYSENHPENSCYCKSNHCPLDGIVNISRCYYDYPIFISAPHFYGADPSLVKPFNGLHPEKTIFQSIFKIQSTFGVLVTLRELYQLNINLKKIDGISQFDMFENDMILPIAWFEVIIDEETIDPDVKRVLYLLSFTVPLIKELFKYGFPLLIIVCLGCLIVITSKKGDSKNYFPIH